MMARSHVLAGAAAWVAYSAVTGAPLTFALVLVAAGASLLPDMDHPKSVFGSLIKPVSIIISKIFGHRGITHSLLAVMLLVWVTVQFGKIGNHLVAAMAVGYLSHLAADFMTPAGVPLLYPLDKKFCFPITVKTGGFGESMIIATVVILTTLHLVMPNTSYMTVFSTIKNTVFAALGSSGMIG